MISYGPGAATDSMARIRRSTSIDELPACRTGTRCAGSTSTASVTPDVLAEIGEKFGLHPLALEDVANVTQRPKVEAYEKHLFIVTRIPLHSSAADGPTRPLATTPTADTPGPITRGPLATEQLSLRRQGLRPDPPGAARRLFDPVRARLRESRRLRSLGADYLAYALLDPLIDGYFPVLEALGERARGHREEVVDQPDAGPGRQHPRPQARPAELRRAVWPQREMISALMRDETPFIERETKVFLRDCYDHAVQIMDMVETYREIASGLLDVYLSSVSNRMNEIMKVLTIIATIFIPLTFIAGVYGMNFNPEARRGTCRSWTGATAIRSRCW